ncbi:MAG: hypothetical protein ACOY5B_13835 [Spirochaetota bacterium]
MKKIRRLALSLTLFSCGMLHAEVILLKDGDIFSGKIIKETPALIVMKSAYGEIRIKPNEIKFIIREEKKIPVEQIEQNGKTIAARFVDETAVARIYISEDYQIIRIPRTAKAPDAGATQSTASSPANRLEIRTGSFFSTLPYINLSEFKEGKEKLATGGSLEQNFSLTAAYKRQWASVWRAGVQAGGQYGYNSQIDEISSFKFSRTGKYLGISAGLIGEVVFYRSTRHEASAGIGGGIAFNRIELDLNYPDTEAGATTSLRQNLQGKKFAPYGEIVLSYAYRLTPRVQVLASLNSRIDFYRTVYQEINGQTINEQQLTESLKDPVLNEFTFPIHTGLNIGVALNW